MAHSYGHNEKHKPLWLVQPRLDATEYRDKLMGSVVKYPDMPIERHIPYRSPKLPLELVPDLDPKPVQVHNLQFWMRNIMDANVHASVNDIMQAFADRAKEDSSESVATVARVWHMDSPGEKFKDLLRNRQYFDELFELLQSNHNAGYFVTDMITLVNLETTQMQGNSKSAGAKAQVPVDPSLGVDIGAGAKLGVLREKGYSACFEGEIIVFMGYRKVELEKVDGMRARLRRVIQGEKHGYSVANRQDYWPKMAERPVDGNSAGFLGRITPRVVGSDQSKQLTEDAAQDLEDYQDIVDALGFDPCIGAEEETPSNLAKK